MRFQFDNGGREAAGFKGRAGDCVCRSIAIASGRPYAEIYARLAAGTGASAQASVASAQHQPEAASTPRANGSRTTCANWARPGRPR